MLLFQISLAADFDYIQNQYGFNYDYEPYKFWKNFYNAVNNMCITDNNCFHKFNLDNYCCFLQCCNIIQYITRDE